MSGITVKTEQESAECTGLSDAAANPGWYEGHQVKDEVVVGPEVLQLRDVAYTHSDALLESLRPKPVPDPKSQPTLRDCFVSLKHISSTELIKLQKASEDGDDNDEEIIRVVIPPKTKKSGLNGLTRLRDCFVLLKDISFNNVKIYNPESKFVKNMLSNGTAHDTKDKGSIECNDWEKIYTKILVEKSHRSEAHR